MKKICLLFLTLIPFISFAQTKMMIGLSCSYYNEKIPAEIYSFTSDNEAQTALVRITNASGLPTNFKLFAGNVPNACATIKFNPTTKNYDRYIIYNQTFMQRLKNAANDWAALSILAHEIGHHLSGHTLMNGGSRPELELEADKFSGFILGKLGASLEDAQSAITVISTENYSLTHPLKSARLAAIANGWVNSTSNNGNQNNKKITSYKPVLSSPEVLRDLVYKKHSNESLSLYHPLSGYTLKDIEDYRMIKLSGSTDMILYLIEGEAYYLLQDYVSTTLEIEKSIKYITGSNAVYIRHSSGGNWIFDNGKSINATEFLGDNGTYNGQSPFVVVRSPKSGTRYWIVPTIFYNGSYFKIYPIHSE